jgi:Tfp pilus assembly protein PilO
MAGLSTPAIPLSPVMLRALLPLGLATGITIAVPFAVYFMTVTPASDRLAVAESAYQAAKADKTKLDRDRAVQLQAKSVRESLEDVWAALPSQKDFTTLALEVSDLGRAQGVHIPGMSYAFKPDKTNPAAIEATLTFQAKGSYASVYRFLHHLEHHRTPMVLDRLDVRREGAVAAKARSMVSIQVTLTTFLRPGSVVPGAKA